MTLLANGFAQAASTAWQSEAAPALHLKATGVERRFARDGGELHALGPVELALRRGEFFSIIGPSGCGKSSLLDVLAGLAAPSAGGVIFENEPVKAGATPDGIGMVYPIALKKGFRTAGIVSSLGRAQGTVFSTGCDVVFIVEDSSWGGWQDDGRLSPTSQAICASCEVMVGIGGGAIAGAELVETRRMGKAVRFHRADMNHGLAIERAARAGEAPPTDFTGAAQKLFSES